MATNIVPRFFAQARAVALGEARDFGFDAAELLEIVEDPAAQAHFEFQLASLNDPELTSRIRVYIRRFAEELEREESRVKRRAKWFSGVGTQLARGLAITGGGAIIASIATGVTALPAAILFGCGVGGMLICASVEDKLEARAENLGFQAKRFREMIK